MFVSDNAMYVGRYVDMVGLGILEKEFKIIQAFSILLCFVILFKFLGRHPRMGILVATLSHATSGLITFCSMGIIVYEPLSLG